jgi:hypothetical protein
LGNWLKIGVLVAIYLIPLFIVPTNAESDVVIYEELIKLDEKE